LLLETVLFAGYELETGGNFLFFSILISFYLLHFSVIDTLIDNYIW